MARKCYNICVGRKYRLIPKLYRPFIILIGSNFCNQYFKEENKVKFINQLLNWFYKSRWGYKALFKIDKIKGISEGDLIIICARTQKVALRNLLFKLNYELLDYDILKKRQYILNFMFLFLNINDKLNKEVYLDIVCSHEDKLNIFIIISGYYLKKFYSILYYYEHFAYKGYNAHCNLTYINDSIFDIFLNNINLDNEGIKS